MGNQIGTGKMEADLIGAGVGTGKTEAAPVSAGVSTGKTEAAPVGAGKMEADLIGAGDKLGIPEEKGLEITADQLEALEKASIDLAVIKLREASDYFNAAGCFAAARQVSYLPEPEPLAPVVIQKVKEAPMIVHDLFEDIIFHRMSPRARILSGVYKATPAQVRAVQQFTRKQLKLDPVVVDPIAAEVHREFTRTAGLGENVMSASDVARILKIREGMSSLHPDDQKKLEMIKIFVDNINAGSAICTAGGSVLGGMWTLRHWNTSFPMSDLPEDWVW
ncbi:hypothetical protein CFC21_009332 [Triticum aestivum]|uniref:Uncharacterized protein n=2 Tax=Triticum aestivum TaxID=4565 RepID=A0A3B5Z6A0_WHEAT|nr:uncharacterized protein LOC123148762 [Triticum aestivum]XP_044424192.1 uncharacterized protein LOC123148762 [Triticum aestivum]KAF6992329.1 hypothetical protein CFC21_009332 [Triticum aestivum]